MTQLTILVTNGGGLTAYGDFISGLLALASLIALRARWRWALLLVWLFSIVGAADLLNALRQADAVPNLGTTWYIPTFWAPILLVTHGLIFARLVKQWVQSLNRSSVLESLTIHANFARERSLCIPLR